MTNQAEEQAAKEERRRYFRVEDIMPVSIRRIEDDLAHMKAKILPSLTSEWSGASMSEEIPDEAIHPHLWKALVQINRKLDLLFDHLHSQEEGISRAETRKVCLSATGLRLRIKERFETGEPVEIKIFLTGNNPVWLLLYGEIARIEGTGTGEWEAAIDFAAMGDEVRDTLIFYTMNRQRETIIQSLSRED